MQTCHASLSHWTPSPIANCSLRKPKWLEVINLLQTPLPRLGRKRQILLGFFLINNRGQEWGRDMETKDAKGLSNVGCGSHVFPIMATQWKCFLSGAIRRNLGKMNFFYSPLVCTITISQIWNFSPRSWQSLASKRSGKLPGSDGLCMTPLLQGPRHSSRNNNKQTCIWCISWALF